MSRKLSYADAVKLLGGESRVVAALDRLTGGLLLAATGVGGEFVLSLFDARSELARLSRELVTGLSDRMRGLSRFDRTSRLSAAQSVLVITAYFEAVRDAPLPFDSGKLRLGRSESVRLATGRELDSARLPALARILNDSDLPRPMPRDGRDTMTTELRLFYTSLGEDLVGYFTGHPLWESLSEGERAEVADVMGSVVPDTAVARYEELFRALAVEFPEVAFWSNRLDHAATHTGIDELRTGLAGLGRVLEQLAIGQPPDERRAALARRYLRQLERPVVAAGEIPEGLTLPSLVSAYVNPSFRVAPVIRADRLDEEGWWERHPVRDDLQEFLLGHLTSPHATASPLIVLGQPGSGKSVLTKVLAARLPPSDFLVVRVVLREVPADTDLQSQIEYAVRDATGEALSWPALARSAGDALPVILLDGFDELLQATGIGQTDYLEQVARFQEREADHGRPVAVLITSRTAVADRARIPPAGAVAVRLEPFSESQIARWLEAWNAANAGSLARRGLETLSVESISQHPELASQPLLLLLLALYDATDNAFQRSAEMLASTELYERILTDFAEREIRKSAPGLQGGELKAAVEDELLRLSVAAFAMFNRGRQWATEEELTADITALLPAGPAPRTDRFAVPSTPGQMIIGRFFFVHQSQALLADTRLTTCEFLHATFGEFLVARLIARELADLGELQAVATARTRQTADESFLRALLSFAPLTSRDQVVEFVLSLSAELERPEILRDLLLGWFNTALEPGRDIAAYQPSTLSVTERHAAWSANLLLLAVGLGDGPIAGGILFPNAPYPAREWRRYALLWRSQLEIASWSALTRWLRLDRLWTGDDRDISVSLGPWHEPDHDPFWIHRIPPGDGLRSGGWRLIAAQSLRRESYFTCDTSEDIAWHALEPFKRNLLWRAEDGDHDEATTEFGQDSAAHALIRLWLISGQPSTCEELSDAYRSCLSVIQLSRPSEETSSRDMYLTMVLRQLAADADRVLEETLSLARGIFERTLMADGTASRDQLAWFRQAFGER
ncbi:hypothetical protein ABGB12_01115 [Actinocorallia sp. B10E7]|uniref:NACHT domain-containing protein n=1 Tax=Actinocorallia sp. B10E7 TaxID=3153558 RepID=UPI00325F4194